MIQTLPRLFICYSRKDEEFAEKLVNDLIAAGFEVWVDKRNILPGANWGDSIQDGLDSAETMLLVVTPESMTSKNVKVEWEYYFDSDKPIIPLLLKPTKRPFQINRLQYVDFVGASYEHGLNGVLARFGIRDQITDPKVGTAHQISELLSELENTSKKMRWTQVIEVGEQILALDGNHKTAREKTARAYRILGQSYHNNMSYDRAIANYNRAIELNPNEAIYFYSRGKSYYKRTEHDRAIADFNRAIELDPNNVEYFYLRGLSYDANDEYNLAVADFSRAIELDPDNAEYFSVRGDFYQEKGEYGRAIADFNRAIELDPNNASYFEARGATYSRMPNKQTESRRDLAKAAALRNE